ncbi:SPS1 Serine threonine protein kinase [Pyrenophora tritici-repentis]|uniref:Calmodulin dependent protein kinase n=1 Tax=Pyrenophora tritici-repentis TaxID=45151 RepID=A0A2W1DHD8_9PLEO|nr:Calmodulin dependent protein kinase [Pyrenophora tritici-repentis]KAF7453628.1 Calmodulin dependent protein kinase [Pyrenophora tritici-repentis]KAF7576710.1 SPS1, Serine-threonine protein kinase [Pyrenophora tritici-repentis]KAG9387391.1 Calmodulin dependent protein kinase [Pyrenophora tritici-repentis]KAI0583015.1 Calmodulin dependent protein kinase [Pyrenophora tritici-repentis]
MSPTPRPPSKQSSDPNLRIYTSQPTLDVPALVEGGRPSPVKFMSTPAYQSPLRHHKRAASSTRRVKETFNARSEYSNSEDDGSAQHRINQYLVKQEIGRGSFGAVHLAVDQYGNEYAVKEFSKSRLRKRAQSNLLRRPTAAKRMRALPAGIGFNSPLHRHSTTEENNAFELIKEEIAIMKKLNHPNLVSLIEVLDDPEEDSLYMVMEMCKKGVVMQVGLEERADPYSEEQCRCWFRDMILGLEYLHAQGIIHRDIKPDNCLITEEDVLKIVDFGVSEMFDKAGEMKTAKSAGSPAFMPPELCVAKHGHVSGRAADIWSMGCTLYCLLFGRIPFEKHGMIELYQSIRLDPVEFESECSPDVKDLLQRLMEKDPQKRIQMEEIREHPWVTRQGTDPLLPKSENVAIIIEPPTDEEVNAAITGNMGHLVTVVRAVKRFKQLLFRRRPERIESILGSASRMVQPPLSMRPSALRKSKSQDTHDRRPVESVLTAEGVHHQIKIDDKGNRLPQHEDDMAYSKSSLRPDAAKKRPSGRSSAISSPTTPRSPALADGKVVHENMSFRPAAIHSVSSPTGTSLLSSGPTTPIGKGQAHNPLEDTLFLNIGTGENFQPDPEDGCVVSESPSNVDINVYEAAYEEEVQRIIAQRRDEYKNQANRRPTLYLTRRVENVKSIRDSDAIFDEGQDLRQNIKVSLKSFVTKTKEDIEARGELQKIQDGKEGKLSRTMRNVREAKRLVEEARERVKTEERDRERERSRSATPVPRNNSSGSVLSRSGTPVGG